MLGADTLVFLDGEILGKPRDLAHARRMLKKLSGRTHQVVTGVCLMHLRAHHERIFAVSTDVLFRACSDETIADYLAKVNTLDKPALTPFNKTANGWCRKSPARSATSSACRWSGWSQS